MCQGPTLTSGTPMARTDAPRADGLAMPSEERLDISVVRRRAGEVTGRSGNSFERMSG
jgi:hypothetical protein